MELTDVYEHWFLSARVAFQIRGLEQHRIWMAFTTLSIMAALFWICETTPENSLRAFCTASMNDGYSLRVPVEGVKPDLRVRCKIATCRVNKSDSTGAIFER